MDVAGAAWWLVHVPRLLRLVSRAGNGRHRARRSGAATSGAAHAALVGAAARRARDPGHAGGGARRDRVGALVTTRPRPHVCGAAGVSVSATDRGRDRRE